MAPHGDTTASPFARKLRLSSDGLLRTRSEIIPQFSKEEVDAVDEEDIGSLPTISEVEDAECECCGMCEEYTAEYIDRVRGQYLGKWICGLCAEAVKEEMERQGHGGSLRAEEALRSHMSECARFKKIRQFPALYQANVMREILKKGALRAKDTEKMMQRKSVFRRSSSCLPAITRELHELNLSDH